MYQSHMSSSENVSNRSSSSSSTPQKTNYGSNADRIQQVRESNDGRDQYVAPAAIPPVGSIDYYRQRNDDFVQRYTGRLQPPDYYLSYGDKYCRRFTNEMTPKLSDEGKVWLTQARILLQVAIEDKRAADPRQFDVLEKDSQSFRAFAYETHPQVYWDAGLGNLGLLDLVMIGLTPDVGDLVPWEGISQAADIIVRLGRQWIENSVDMVGGEEVVNWLTEQRQEGVEAITELIDEKFGPGATQSILQAAQDIKTNMAQGAESMYEGARKRGIEDIEKTEKFFGIEPGTVNRAVNSTRENAQDAIDSFQNNLERLWPFD